MPKVAKNSRKWRQTDKSGAKSPKSGADRQKLCKIAKSGSKSLKIAPKVAPNRQKWPAPKHFDHCPQYVLVMQYEKFTIFNEIFFCEIELMQYFYF